MDQHDGWAKGWAATTGRCVKRWRAERKLSAQKLANECAALGLPSLTRTVITKLENGRKESVSTAELMVLAKALDVPPVMLMFPFGEQRMVEITPGEFIDPLDATYWVAGQDPEIPGEPADKGSVLALFMVHRRIVDAMLGQHSIWQERATVWVSPYRGRLVGSDEIAPLLPEEERLLGEARYNATILRTTRRAIRDLGLEPPPLPPVMADIEREAE